jgi:hypothetical protein
LSEPFQLVRAVRPSLIALVVGIAAVISGVFTYLALTGLAPYRRPATMVLIVVDLASLHGLPF